VSIRERRVKGPAERLVAGLVERASGVTVMQSSAKSGIQLDTSAVAKAS